MTSRTVETFLSPALFEPEKCRGTIVVIIDILRATSSICTAFANGARAIIPVSEAAEARNYKAQGCLVAAERDGFVLDFADFGNSPFNFTKEKIKDNTVVYSTTNGTGIINMALQAKPAAIVTGSFLNISALVRWIERHNGNVNLFCAGWKKRFNLEDTVFAGAVAERLIKTGGYSTSCDSTHAAMDLWLAAKNDLRSYIEKAAQRSRLREKQLDDCIDFCLQHDFTAFVPVFMNGRLVGVES
ncbi:MAG: 2-phosphosulfolactate phosphatase [Bacteroidales bacterium]|jgi:2-phosphosulfolactate phosphatase|nr:2-phosphosulfolactate phosphatase [Bacteroidales bacterium]